MVLKIQPIRNFVYTQSFLIKIIFLHTWKFDSVINFQSLLTMYILSNALTTVKT